MPQDALADIQERAARKDERMKARLREHYQLARSLGFSPTMAQIMSGWSRKRILALAEQQSA